MFYEVYMHVERNKEIEVVKYFGEGVRDENVGQAIVEMKTEMKKFDWNVG